MPRRDKAWLMSTAKAIVAELQNRKQGTRLRIRVPRKVTTTDTDGWRTCIGDLGKGQPYLEIWLDRFSGYSERKLYAGFYSTTQNQINLITKKVADDFNSIPIRTVTYADTVDEDFLHLSERLRREEFGCPILEKYSAKNSFFGIYSITRETSTRVNRHFCTQAVAFFEDVARLQTNAMKADEKQDIYPQCENRALVVSHLQRERSRYLATAIKIRDDYICQICGISFEDKYGVLGREFAEAHHKIPLSLLKGKVKTQAEDLITVCANCHRMLHRMNGEKGDIAKLKKIVQKHAVGIKKRRLGKK